MLIPIRLDGAVFDTDKAWAETLTCRNIGDFSQWHDDDAFDKAYKKLLIALRCTKQTVPESV